MRSLLFSGVSLTALTALSLINAASAQTLQGVTKNEILIGMHTDLSGVVASFGVSSSNGIRMRIDEINEAGGVQGRKLKLIVEDHGYQVPKAVQAGSKLIKRDKIFMMVGSLGTPMNNAVLPEQLAANIPNLFPLTAARQMVEPFNRLKFAGYASYYDQIRAGVKWMVQTKGKKTICAMYQDTDFGKEVLEGIEDQVKAMGMKLAESVSHKPTDQDFTASITKLKAANCDLIAAGVIIRDAIIPYATARKIGWTDVDFIGQSASFDQIVAGAQGNATEGFYSAGYFAMPYRDTLKPEAAAWWDRYKAKFNMDPAIGALYGYDAMDTTIRGLQNAGPNLTTDSFIKGMESITSYADLFGGPVQSYSPTKHAGSNVVVISQVRNGRYVPVSDQVGY